MKKNFFIVLIGLVMLLVTSAWYLFVYANDDSNTDDGQNNSNTTNENFSLTKNYKGENKWEYTVVGTLPTPCHTATVDIVVRESYPEQVSVMVEVVEPNADEICAQVIEDYTYTGEFTASEEASIELAFN